MTRRAERALANDLGGRAVQSSAKALFISLSNVGDAIMTTPALELLHARYPEHSIDIVADRRSGEIFEHCPYRGEIFYKNKRAPWRGVPALLGQLRANFYDVVVDLRSDGLAYLLRVRRRYTKWGARAARGPHAVQRLMAIVEGLLGPAEIPPQRIWVNEAAREFARRVLADLPGRRWLVLGPGAKWPKKVWPAQRFIDMVKSLEDRFDSVIVLGGPGDVAPAAEVTAGLRLPVLNLAGQTSILEDCAVLAQAQVFVGNDSGLGHMASAVGIPTLTVFGPTDALRYHPWGQQADWLCEPEGRLEALSGAAVAARLRLHLERLEVQGDANLRCTASCSSSHFLRGRPLP